MRPLTKAYVCLVFICIVWGTTYLAIRIGAVAFPPFLFAGVRQLIAGFMIIAFGLAVSRKVDISAKALLHQGIVGFLMITVGNGLVTWGEKEVPSGVAALICGMMPVCAVVINLMINRKEKINLTIVAGLVLGVAGVSFIFKDNLKDLAKGQYLLHIIGIFCATTAWAWGSIINKKRPTVTNPTFNAGLQLFIGGFCMMIISACGEDWKGINLAQTDALWSLVYLILFGSVLAYTAYMYALRMLPVGIVTSYAYINPLVAVVIAYFVKDGTLTLWTLFSFIAITGGVYLVSVGYQRQKAKNLKEVTLAAPDLPND